MISEKKSPGRHCIYLPRLFLSDPFSIFSRVNKSTWIQKIKTLPFVLILAALLFTLLRIYPLLTPIPSEINAHDEAGYIHSGYEFFLGKPLELAYHPLVSFVFAGGYWILQRSSNWFIEAEWLARAALILLLWVSVLMMTRPLSSRIPVWAIAWIWAVTLLGERLLGNTSQLVFTILFTLTVWQVLLFHTRQQLRHLFLASTFLGFAFLARAEALWILLLTIPCILAISNSESLRTIREKVFRLSTSVLTYSIPFALITILYVVFYGASTGSYETGLGERSYDALEAGQGLSYPERYSGNLYLSGILDARSIYGDRLENNGSVFMAALHNPEAMLDRVLRNALATPKNTIQGFGGFLGAILLIFSLGGVVQLAREKQWKTLVILFSFPLFLLLYIPFFWLASYFLFIFPIMFILAAIGMRAVIEGHQPWLWAGFACLAIICSAIGFFSVSVRFLYLGFGLTAMLFVCRASIKNPFRTPIQSVSIGCLLFFLSRPTYTAAPTILPNLSVDPMAQAVQWLENNSQENQAIASWGSTVSFMAQRPFISLEGYLNAPTTLYQWLLKNDVQYVYLDSSLKGTFPDVMTAIDALATQGCLVIQFESSPKESILYATQAQCASAIETP